MTVFENIKSKNIDKFVDWIDENFAFDIAPFMNWFDNNFCKRCQAEKVYDMDCDKETEYAWCEVTDKCRFFQDMDEIPNVKQIIKLWLESEA